MIKDLEDGEIVRKRITTNWGIFKKNIWVIEFLIPLWYLGGAN